MQGFFLDLSPTVCACVHEQSCSTLTTVHATLWTAAHQSLLSTEFFRQEYWIGLSFPTPGDLPEPGIKPESLVFPALAGRFFTNCITQQARCVQWSNV